MEMQHINVKLPVKHSEDFDLEPLIPIFHSWIQDKVFDELLLDIADYRHVHHGPGIVLIGHEGDYAVDNTDGLLGVRYNRKTALDGSNLDRLRQATRAALTACQHLQTESSLDGNLQYDGQSIEIFVNDRLLAPNTASARAEAESDFRSFLDALFRGSKYSFSFLEDPRRLLTASAKVARPFPLAELLANLE